MIIVVVAAFAAGCAVGAIFHAWFAKREAEVVAAADKAVGTAKTVASDVKKAV